MTLLRNSSSVILKNVSKLISEKVAAERQTLVEKFASILFENLSNEDLDKRIDEDLYGAALSLYNDFSDTKSAESTIKVFNPELGNTGWSSENTIVQIVVDDLPFLVDSVRMTLNRLNITSHLLLHSPIKVNRDKKGAVVEIVDLKDATKSTNTQTVFFIEVDRQSEQKQLDALAEELSSVLSDVSIAVEDWKPIEQKLAQCIDEAKNAKIKNEAGKQTSLEFLDWIADHNFTLMGYREYTVKAVKGDFSIKGVDETSLGLMKNRASSVRLLSELSDVARAEAFSDNVLVLTKTDSKSRVHRPAYMDYIGIKKFDDEGNVVGEHRFIGLYAASFYNSSVQDIPLLNIKLQRITEGSSFAEGSHAQKALLNVLETYPRDELIQASDEHLREVALGVLQMQERDMTKLFIRKDTYGRFYSCMVFVRRERYNTALRRDTQEILNNALGSDGSVEFTTYFSESPLARTHYIVHATEKDIELNVKDIENNLIEAAKTWEDKLATALTKTHGSAKGRELAARYAKAFPKGYKEEILPSTATVDISFLEKLTDNNKLAMLFYRAQESVDKNAVRLSLFHKDEPIHLSDVLPILENFGLRVIGETPYAVAMETGVNWIMDFTMTLTNADNSDFDLTRDLFQQAFAAVWENRLENDGFNRLILGAKLSGREASVIRAYAKYMRQIGVTFSQSYIESTFDRYPKIAGKLVKLFEHKFNPTKHSVKKYEKAKDQILVDLDNVANLDDDRIIRLYITLMDATLRTNFYQNDEQGNIKPYISFKLLPEQIPEVPLPRPKFEIFVYSPRVEGVHLRGGKVARGGLRWSDRMEDFRTEVLGLVKAQQVKNTVIVPNGSKGGFVCKQLPTAGGRDAFFTEGQECYKTFIRGLLDVTDNIIKGEVIPPKSVVRHDEDDTYLVVAADKGTATFSDIANAISDEYNFWLGDAFASGGSVGYDHKKMGITARGAWESVKRHFREMGTDCQTTDFTCVAIGDMAGDVFGNGMLLSKHIRLQVAFNHMHIFVDPNPDSASTYVERDRLFKLPRSSWEDYDKSLISQGGGIFSRSAKSIPLSPEMKKMLGTKKASMTPTELMKAALLMPVDLIWNGGIGTYVKAKSENDAQVGDRANDALRVNGSELRAKIFGEGGNLGLTQLGRIEFAASGGRINTDFVDNVGGVDCSDNEVNIKILLNQLVNEGELTKKHRDQTLYEMTDDVSKIVIQDCYRQTHTISITELKGQSLVKEQLRFIHALEKAGKLDRELEFLPNDEEVAERQAKGAGFTRPELAVLVAYGKMILKEQFAIDEIDSNPYYKDLLINAFPQQLQTKYEMQIQSHPLRKEIIATKLANEVVNDMGLNFVIRMQEETGAPVDEVLTCYVIAREVFGLQDVWAEIEKLDNKIPAIVQTEMLHQMRRTIRRAARWFLRHRNKSQNIAESISLYKPTFEKMNGKLGDYLVEKEKGMLVSLQNDFEREGVPTHIAAYVAQLSSIFSIMDIADVARTADREVEEVAALYYTLGADMGLHWFLDQITNQAVGNHWQALARASYREELDWQQRALTGAVIHFEESNKNTLEVYDKWKDEYSSILARWQQMIAEFKTSDSHEFAKFSVALRELMLLSHHCETAV
ncbi:NAD-glutamate dehydrogenase [Psychrosphaera sp. 1_MG-2023]|uniref:NAD-glutamate dehydrogenase n=1 Tax=Psychrosphaera sp. 1_MG-2023 TaxID=3062643 RepID=UPI0026E3DE19|nr:NAD-glutamate dehydrogenase [Psychrosphaera sp. 1_MG-2023]MDO6720112.1 NAD-glutamate dehydrogenase [Psychrosphaera sp. 1_MG-2023]